jgi:hypothetical protein
MCIGTDKCNKKTQTKQPKLSLLSFYKKICDSLAFWKKKTHTEKKLFKIVEMYLLFTFTALIGLSTVFNCICILNQFGVEHIQHSRFSQRYGLVRNVNVLAVSLNSYLFLKISDRLSDKSDKSALLGGGPLVSVGSGGGSETSTPVTSRSQFFRSPKRRSLIATSNSAAGPVAASSPMPIRQRKSSLSFTSPCRSFPGIIVIFFCWRMKLMDR